MRSKKLTDSAKHQTCIRCGNPDPGVVCARHYNGLWQQAFGKGMGEKASDLATAELCNKCDEVFTEGDPHGHWTRKGGSSGFERAAEFMKLCILTNIRRAERGDLKA